MATGAPPKSSETLAQLQQRLEHVAKSKEANAVKGKKCDEKLRIAFKNPPKRPNITEEKIDEEMDRLELRRSTTSMSLTDEKFILRELTLLKEKKTQIQEYHQFQEMIDTTKKERQECYEQHRAYDEQIKQLQVAIKKLTLATKLHCSVSEFVTVEVSVPEDRMGAVIGKGSARMQQIEQDCGVVLEIDDQNKLMRIMSTSKHAQLAKEAIEDITLASSHSFGLHPDAMKMLLVQKSKNLQELEQRFKVKIDINKVDGILTCTAAPTKAAQLQKAVKELTEGSADIALPAEIVPKLIGKKGETINQLMEDTGCLVDIDKVSNTVRLRGSRESVAMAKKFVQELIESQSQREREFSVHDAAFFPSPDFVHFKFDFFAEFLMANKGKQLKILRTDASEARIKVLKQEKKIHVIGNKGQLKAMEEALRERLREFENHHWLYHVPDNFVLSLIIGKKGAKIKQIEEECAEGNVRIDIQGEYLCVFGDNNNAIEKARALIMEVVDQNQRSFFLTSQYLIAILMNNKREKLQEIETSSGAKVNVPPPPSSGGSSRPSADAEVKITLTGSLEAISKAKALLEELDERHHVRYLPLDDDEVPTVIGKKGETIIQLESSSGAKLRVSRQEGNPPELEMIGTEEQLSTAQKAIDELLQTKNREILQLDSFAAGCLIGKKGERINALRTEHPEANVDAFPNRGQVRIKASNEEALRKCVDHVLKTLRETIVVETVRAPTGSSGLSKSSTANFHTVLQEETIAMRLHELEAEGGENAKVIIADDGKSAKIRGPAMGIGKLKTFLEMLVSSDPLFVETIKLPTFAYANVLVTKGNESQLNENAIRICKQTGCELRLKKTGAAGTDGSIRVEGTDAKKVYEAKESVEKVLQFYFGDNINTLEDLPEAVIPRLYELLPVLSAKFRVVFSLASKASLRIMTDSKDATRQVVQRVKQEIESWKKEHVEVKIPSWMVSLFVGKNGENIKKLTAECNGARLTLSTSGSKNEDKVLTISAREEGTLQLAMKKVEDVMEHHKNKSASVSVPKNKLDLALLVKRELKSGLQFHLIDMPDGSVEVRVYGGEHEDREQVTERIEHLLEHSAIENIVLPEAAAPSVKKSVIGALIGKSGANIRALQQEFPRVVVDIQRGENAITLKGPTEDVTRVKHVMQDKVNELMQQEEIRFQRRPTAYDQGEPSSAGQSQDTSSDSKAQEKQTNVENDGETAGVASGKSDPSKFPAVPVGGNPAMATAKLTKNQRRRMRRRAENEKKSDVLSMIMGDSTESSTNAVSSATDNGYYHSSSGYSLRL